MCLELNFAFINRVREKEKLKNGRGRRNKISLTSGSAEVQDFHNILGAEQGNKKQQENGYQFFLY